MGSSKEKYKTSGYRCPVRGCPSKKSKLFDSVLSAATHIVAVHGEDELAKRLRVKEYFMSVVASGGGAKPPAPTPCS